MSESTIDRRALLKTAGVAAVGFAASTYAAGSRRKFVNVGVGSRSRMYLTAITKTFAANNELVAVCDVNRGRLDVAARFVAPNGAKPSARAYIPLLASDERRPVLGNGGGGVGVGSARPLRSRRVW